jgi:cell division protein FtsL
MKQAPETRGWRNRPLVRELDDRGARSLWRVLGGLAIALSPAVACVVEQNECLRVSYELSAVRAEQEALRKEEQRLRVEQARLESYASIESWALEERGLAVPAARQVLVLPLGHGTDPDPLLAGLHGQADGPR